MKKILLALFITYLFTGCLQKSIDVTGIHIDTYEAISTPLVLTDHTFM